MLVPIPKFSSAKTSLCIRAASPEPSQLTCTIYGQNLDQELDFIVSLNGSTCTCKGKMNKVSKCVKLSISSYPSDLTYVLGTQKNHLTTNVLLSTHNVCSG